MNNKIQPNLDLKNTTPILSENGRQVFIEGVLFRSVSRFITGTNEDSIVSIPVFFEPSSGKILVELLPKEIREEYKNYNNSI
jgi:hypothetical protein